MTDLLDDIYDAIGDQERWERLARRLAAGVTADIAQHVEIARRAHDQHQRLASEVAALSAMHDQLPLGALLVDVGGRILRANALGRRLLSEVTGAIVFENCGWVTGAHEHAGLRTAIEEIARGRRRTTPFVLIERPGRASLAVFVVRSDTPASQFFEDGPAALLLLVDPDVAQVAGSRMLTTLFGFTAREAECAGLLMQGLTIAQAARALGVTRPTARTFLAHMAGKTDTHTQSELVAQLLAIPGLPAQR
jgi:DNA-binding CsgD family transcriptional regulator